MFKRSRLPQPGIDECLLGALAMNGIFVTYFFLAATSVAAPELSSKGLPAGWEAAVPNHGGYFQWYLIGNHPFLFAACVLLILVPGGILYWIRKGDGLQLEPVEATPLTRIIARIFGVAAYILSGLWFAFHVAATIYPA